MRICGIIDREAYTCFAVGAEQGVQLPHVVFDVIYDKFDGYIWYIQCLPNCLYVYNRNVDIELVMYAMELIVSKQSHTDADLLKTTARDGCVKGIVGEFY